MNSIKSFLWPVQGKLGEWEKISYHYASEEREGHEHRPYGYRTATTPGTPATLHTDYTALHDKSTGNLYMDDPGSLIRYKAVLSTAFTPVHAVAAIALNIIRLALAPLYFTVQAFVECAPSKAFHEWRHITGRSLMNCLRAVFYGIACTLAGVYTILDPINGRKVYGAYERAWNRQIPVEFAVHIFAPREYFKMKNPFKDDNAYYLPGCFQPVWYVDRTGEPSYAEHCQALSKQVSEALTSVAAIQRQLRANINQISGEMLVPGSGFACFRSSDLKKQDLYQFPEYTLDPKTLRDWGKQFTRLEKAAAHHQSLDPHRRKFVKAWVKWRSLVEKSQRFSAEKVDERVIFNTWAKAKPAQTNAFIYKTQRLPLLGWVLC